MSEEATQPSLSAKDRQELFLQLAAHADGVTAQQVHEQAIARGDTVTVEAFHNLGRRLVHRGLLVNAGNRGRQSVFRVGTSVDGQWLDEEQLAAIIDPEYPLIALTVVREARRQISAIPEDVWMEVRTRLQSANARQVFFDEIRSYADDLRDQLEQFSTESEMGSPNLAHLRGEIETSLILLKQMTKYGLGLSNEAIRVPPHFAAGLEEVRQRPNAPFYSEELLLDEIARRVSDESLVVE